MPGMIDPKDSTPLAVADIGRAAGFPVAPQQLPGVSPSPQSQLQPQLQPKLYRPEYPANPERGGMVGATPSNWTRMGIDPGPAGRLLQEQAAMGYPDQVSRRMGMAPAPVEGVTYTRQGVPEGLFPTPREIATNAVARPVAGMVERAAAAVPPWISALVGAFTAPAAPAPAPAVRTSAAPGGVMPIVTAGIRG